jgi:hypothetical protein
MNASARNCIARISKLPKVHKPSSAAARTVRLFITCRRCTDPAGEGKERGIQDNRQDMLGSKEGGCRRVQDAC